MCGILGIVASVGKTTRVMWADAVRMRDRMTNRGPDGAGLFERRNVIFGHRRLAVRDLTGGEQPWSTDDGQTVLVYNGEIYNDSDVRRRLESCGHRFRTRCDTETVMAAWREWGADCVQQLDGMFAFGVYDFRTETLFLARDRCGVKPFFLTEIEGDLVFASSIPAILAHPDFRPRPHWPVLSHYLTTFRLTLGRETIYDGVIQLLPGEQLILRDGQITIETYWKPPVDEVQLSYRESIDLVETQLRDAVRSQLVSDVPVGMFLSGGVDSSTLACLVRDFGKTRLVGQCGGGTGGRTPDFEHARRCADHVDFDYGEVRVGPDDYFERWRSLISAYETPVSTPSDVIIQRLAEEMKKSAGVVLGGEGADEALCGYGVQHWSGNDCELSQQLGTGTWRGSASAADLFRSTMRKHYGREQFPSEEDHFFTLNSLIPSAAKPALLRPDTWRQANADRSMWDHYRYELSIDADRPLSWRYRRLLHRVNLESLLSRLDSATMQASLEARVPYTDTRLVETAFRLPMSHCIDVDPEEQSPQQAAGELDFRGSLRTKRVLRSVAGRIMPAELANRRKASFPTPVAKWIAGPWQQKIRETLTESAFAREHFRPEAIAELTENPSRAGMWLWPILNVCIWGDQAFAA